jgi:hypothetical protein
MRSACAVHAQCMSSAGTVQEQCRSSAGAVQEQRADSGACVVHKRRACLLAAIRCLVQRAARLRPHDETDDGGGEARQRQAEQGGRADGERGGLERDLHREGGGGVRGQATRQHVTHRSLALALTLTLTLTLTLALALTLSLTSKPIPEPNPSQAPSRVCQGAARVA